MTLLEDLKQRAHRLKTDIYALYLAARHPDTPWYAKLLVAGIVAYALSPIDLIPDFIPRRSWPNAASGRRKPCRGANR